MKAARPYPIVTITPKGERAIVDGHPWVYEGEVVSISGTPEDGSLVDVVSKKGSWLGCGFYNSASKIRVRLVTRNANDDPAGDAFWKRRLRYAWDYRKTVMGETDSRCCRIIFGEADGFPGLTVDRFERVLVAQVLSLGMERIKERVLPLLVRILREDGQVIRGVYERNDAALRTLEGMAQGKGWLVLPGEAAPEGTAEDITENGIRYTVDFENGQKTGFFLDQKYNRLAVAKLAKGKTVLDCFTHTGSFALNAAKGGAEHVTAVDVSASAIEMARENARRNGLEEKMDFITADVFDLLPELAAKGKAPYDFIILDPPAFTKSRKTVNSAERGYKEINLRALKLLPRGGYFATASCSHFMPSELFVKMLRSAALDAGVELRQIEARQQAPDHPILWNVPETDYLKFYLFQVV
ncbi:MAG: class I SAM-dependent rRNA methyltransferase [Clostridia bacterium]|nr:class I SAM-dependent rRNA methyltransferase [Clostridia bacterium]